MPIYTTYIYIYRWRERETRLTEKILQVLTVKFSDKWIDTYIHIERESKKVIGLERERK